MFHILGSLRPRGFRITTSLLGFVILFGAVSVTRSQGQDDGLATRVADYPRSDSDPFGVSGFDCSRMEELSIEKQMNLRAGAILKYCQQMRGESDPSESPADSLVSIAYARPSSPSNFGGTDINMVAPPAEGSPIFQAESAAWGHGSTVVVAYDDGRGAGSSPASRCGVSVSTDGGVTFTRSSSLFNLGGTCVGDPSLFYSKRVGRWFVGFLAGRCGSMGYGQWESADGINWDESGCYTTTGTSDGLTTWVDNNPASPFYGRQYAAFNNFSVGGGAMQLRYSTDDGLVWSSPVTLFGTLRRSVKVTGSLGADGTVFVQSMDEGGGGLANMRVNHIYRSVTGGASWTSAQQGAPFLGPGRAVCSTDVYFAGMYTAPTAGYWRHMGGGQPGVGPGGVVHYAYASRPGTGDPGNIFYVRSNDNGLTWSTPLQLNTDATTRAQWQPSLSANTQGKVFVSWFDERNTVTDSLERFGRVSLDNGLTWGADMAVSDVIFPKPVPGSFDFGPCYAGDRHDAAFSNDNYGTTAYDTWTDGRVIVINSQQDVFFDKINFGGRAPFDFDGDGKTDIGIFRPLASAEWWINRSQTGVTFALQFGASTDRIAPADYTGDGKADIAFWRPASGEWYVLRSEDNSFFAFPFGASGDIPTPADYDADGKADPAVFRPSSATWFISQSGGGGTRIFQFGINGDQPVVADYDGDARADVAIFRPGPREWWISRSTAGLLAMQFGNTGDKAVQGDYTGDGKTDVAIWRPTTGEWFVVRSEDFSFFGFPFGANGDVIAPGDYDGDGKTDPTVFRPSSATWFIARSTAGTQIVQFGANGDRPIPNAFVP